MSLRRALKRTTVTRHQHGSRLARSLCRIGSLLASLILVVDCQPRLAAAEPTLSSIAAVKGCASGNPVISGDGRHVVLASRCDLLHGNGGGVLPRYRWYRADLTTKSFSEIRATGDCIGAGASINVDGTRIAFGAYCDQAGKNDQRLHVYVADTATGALTHAAAICPCADDASVAISADGTRVTFASCCSTTCTTSDGCYGSIFCFDTQTHQVVQVSKNPRCDNRAPSISADGMRIAYWSKCAHGGARIYYSDPTGAAPVSVATSGDGCGLSPPSISGDGNHIAFISYCDLTGDNPGRNGQIFDFNVAAHTLAQLTRTASGCRYDRLSINTDGRFLAFASDCGLRDNKNSPLGIYRLDTAAGSLTQVTNRSHCIDGRPSVDADGGRIVFESSCGLDGMSRQGTTGVFLADLQAEPAGGARPPGRSEPSWTEYGPHGFGTAWRVITLAVDNANPSTLYAATFPAAALKSTDGGNSWLPADTGLRLSGASDIRAFAIDPTTPGTMYAGSYADGVFKSTNGGAFWQPSNRGLKKLAVTALAVKPDAPGTLYAATIGGGVSLSRDGGRSWSACNNGLTSLDVIALIIDPVTTNTVYAGTLAGGVFKTTDGGSSWTAVNTGLPVVENLQPDLRATTPLHRMEPAPQASKVVYREVGALVIRRDTPSTIYAGTGGGVFASTDGGSSWRAMRDAGKYAVDALVIDPNSPRTLYEAIGGGIFKSVDGGNSWDAVPTDALGSWVWALAVAPGPPSILYAGTQELGVFQSRDGGTSWIPANRGMAKLYITALTTSRDSLFAATNFRGLFRSRDGGCSWSRVTAGLPDPRGVYVGALEVEPGSAGTIYAATTEGEILKSTDDGDTWHRVAVGRPITRLVVDPTVPRTLYAARNNGVFRSTDGGDSWTGAGLNDRYVTAFVIGPRASATLYAGVFNDRVFKSTDGGESWNPLKIWNVSALAITPTAPSTLYAGASGFDRGIFRSSDAGGSWQPATAGLPDLGSLSITGLAADPTKATTIYAATYGYGVLRSTDGGITWESISTKLGTPNITTLAFDPHKPGSLYAGTDDGVYGEHPCNSGN